MEWYKLLKTLIRLLILSGVNAIAGCTCINPAISALSESLFTVQRWLITLELTYRAVVMTWAGYRQHRLACAAWETTNQLLGPVYVALVSAEVRAIYKWFSTVVLPFWSRYSPTKCETKIITNSLKLPLWWVWFSTISEKKFFLSSRQRLEALHSKRSLANFVFMTVTPYNNWA